MLVQALLFEGDQDAKVLQPALFAAFVLLDHVLGDVQQHLVVIVLAVELQQMEVDRLRVVGLQSLLEHGHQTLLSTKGVF